MIEKTALLQSDLSVFIPGNVCILIGFSNTIYHFEGVLISGSASGITPGSVWGPCKGCWVSKPGVLYAILLF